MKQIKTVAGVIRNEKGEVLCTLRDQGKYDYVSFKWEFPGGKIEPGESHHEALKREICEELAVEIAVGQYLCTVEYDYPTFHLTMHCYMASQLDGDIALL